MGTAFICRRRKTFKSKLNVSRLLWCERERNWGGKSQRFTRASGPQAWPPQRVMALILILQKLRAAEVENGHRLVGVKRQNKEVWECFRGPILCIIESSFSSALTSLK